MGLVYLNSKISPALLNYAEIETKKLSSIIINKAITKQISNDIDIESLFTVIQDKDGEIQSVDFNPIIVNKVLSTITSVVQTNLKAVEEGKIEFVEFPEGINIELDKNKLKKGIIYEVPLGVATGNAFLSNLGPRVPVKLNVIGDAISNIRTDVTPYGINNALIQIFVHIEVSEQVNIPFMSKRITVSSDVPVALKLVQGKVPTYYGGTISKDSNIFSIPIE